MNSLESGGSLFDTRSLVEREKMANEKSRKIVKANETDEFDPTKPESGSLVPARTQDGSMSIHLASNDDISAAIAEHFNDLSDQARGMIFEECVQINQATRRVVMEQMRIGASIHTVMRTIISGIHTSFPPSENSIAMAEKRCYAFFNQTQGISKNMCQLYLRKYERFNDNPDALEFLSATDMRTLLSNNRSDDVVNAVIAHRKQNPEAKQKDIDQVVADYEALLKRAQSELDSQSAEIGVLRERTEIAEQMQRDAIDDRAKVNKQLATVQSELEGLRKSREALQLDLRRSTDKYDALLREQADASNRYAQLSAQYREATANPETIERFIDKVPEGYTTLREAHEAAARDLETITAALAAERDTLKKMRDQLAQTNEDLKSAALVRDQFRRMLLKFTEFSAEFSASKLVSTISGQFPGQRDVIASLLDQMKAYAAELQIALDSSR